MNTLSLFPATSFRAEITEQVILKRFTNIPPDHIEEQASSLSLLDPMLTHAASLRSFLLGALVDMHSHGFPESRYPAPEAVTDLIRDPASPRGVEQIEWWLTGIKQHTHYSALALQLTILLRKIKDAGLEPYCSQPPLGNKSTFKTMASSFAKQVQALLDANIATSKQMDVYAECIGFSSGFQQLKPRLLTSLRTRPASAYFRHMLSENDLGGPVVDFNSDGSLQVEKAFALYCHWFHAGITAIVGAQSSDLSNYSQRRLVRLSQDIVAHLFVLLNQQAPSELPRPDMSEGSVWFAAKHVSKEMNFTDDSAISDLMDAYSPGDDGFELAKSLERYHQWDIERDEIDALDEMDDQVRSRQTAAARLWQESGAFLQLLPVGTMLSRGVITDICHHTPGAYLVRERDHQDETHGYRRLVIYFEDAQPEHQKDAMSL